MQNYTGIFIHTVTLLMNPFIHLITTICIIGGAYQITSIQLHSNGLKYLFYDAIILYAYQCPKGLNKLTSIKKNTTFIFFPHRYPKMPPLQ